jgi:hypothetical protein
MEALQATTFLAHCEQTVEKHALQGSNTTTKLIAQEAVVQNSRGIYTQAWGEILENNTPLSLPQRVYLSLGPRSFIPYICVLVKLISIVSAILPIVSRNTEHCYMLNFLSNFLIVIVKRLFLFPTLQLPYSV